MKDANRKAMFARMKAFKVVKLRKGVYGIQDTDNIPLNKVDYWGVGKKGWTKEQAKRMIGRFGI